MCMRPSWNFPIKFFEHLTPYRFPEYENLFSNFRCILRVKIIPKIQSSNEFVNRFDWFEWEKTG